MTTTPPPFDELVSAYIDGEATDAEIARVEQSPELMVEVQRLRALTGALNATEPVAPPPPAQREAHIAAALAAFDVGDTALGDTALGDTALGDTDPEATKPVEVVSLDQRRARRSLPDGRVLGIAAAIALFVLGAAALFSFTGGGGDRFETADVATDAVSDASDGDDASDSDDASESSATAAFDTSSDAAMADEEAEEAMEEAAPEEAAREEDAMADVEAMEEEAVLQDSVAGSARGEITGNAADDTADETAEDADADAPAAAAEEATQAPKIAPTTFLEFSSRFADIDPGTGQSLWLGPTDQLDELSLRLSGRPDLVEPLPRTRCQLDNDDLDTSPTPTLVGLTILNDIAFEVHRLPDTTTTVVVDARTCEILDELSPID